MAMVFHQNLQRFGGGSPQKTSDLVKILNKTRNGAKYDIGVAGFTEVTNAYSSLPQLKKLYSALAVNQYIVAAVGDTALSGLSEFISIGWDDTVFTVKKIGLVQSKFNGGFDYQSQDCTAGLQDGNEYTFTPNDQTDSRGIFFVAGQDTGNQWWVVGFIHNMYQVGDTSLFPRNIGNITKELADTYDDASVIIGGDFNVAPVGARNGYGHSCAAASPIAGSYYLTTRHHVYDWWYVDNNSILVDKHASIGEVEERTITTKAGKLKTMLYPSDHYPILLESGI